MSVELDLIYAATICHAPSNPIKYFNYGIFKGTVAWTIEIFNFNTHNNFHIMYLTNIICEP